MTMFHSSLPTLLGILNKKEIRFLINSSVTATIYIVLLWAFGKDALTNFIIYAFTTILNYLGSKYYTFQNHERPIQSFWKFMSVVLLSLVVNSGFVWTFSEVMHFPYYVSGILFLIFWAIISFLLQKYWVFK